MRQVARVLMGLLVAGWYGAVVPATHGEATVTAGDDTTLIARYVEAENAIFENPQADNGPWMALKPKKVPLLPQNLTTPAKEQTSTDTVEVRVVHNGTWLAVAVSWADESRDETTASGVFCDALAIGFPLKDVRETSPFMGGPGAQVEIDQWRALWQRDIERGYQETVDLHPNTVADDYAGYRSEHLPNSDPASSVPMADVMATPDAREALPAVALGNPMTQIQRTMPVEQSMAAGFGTLSTQYQQDARAHATYADGGWTVVITRPLDTGDAADAVLNEGLETGINFAVWDGSEGDVGSRKSYSMFTPLKIAEKD